MSKPQPIQINIPDPCTQSWDEMTPVDNGRFCNSCQKCVIDFTNYTDAQLFDFFNKHKDENICGKYRVDQLDRDIIIPQHRESRLFRMVASIGFALLLAQMPSVNLYAQSPAHKTVNKDRKNTTKPGILQISGKVTDEKNAPVSGAVVQVFLNGAGKGFGVTDKNGNYTIKSLEAGKYKLRVKQTGLSTYASYVSLNNTIVRNVQLRPSYRQLDPVNVVAYKVPLIDKYNSVSSSKTNEEIERMGGIGKSSPVAVTSYPKNHNVRTITGGSNHTVLLVDGVYINKGLYSSEKSNFLKRAWSDIKKLFAQSQQTRKKGPWYQTTMTGEVSLNEFNAARLQQNRNPELENLYEWMNHYGHNH